jgi:hypothetical protein
MCHLPLQGCHYIDIKRKEKKKIKNKKSFFLKYDNTHPLKWQNTPKSKYGLK